MTSERGPGVRGTMRKPKSVAPRSKRERGTGADVAYELLRRRILSLELEPGTDLDELVLTAACGVSRTPLREALIRLAADRLVVLLPNRGYVVAPLLLSDFPQFIEALAVTQGAVHALAASRRSADDLERIRAAEEAFAEAVKRGDAQAITDANSAFHARVAEACGNEYFGESYRHLLDESIRLARTCFLPEHHRWIALDGHDALIDAIERQDPARAERLGRDHAMVFQRQVVSYLEQNEVRTIRAISESGRPAESCRKANAA
jgi:DNA-binding GntR family transcriptional regulator